MPSIFARSALLQTGWANDVRLEIARGRIGAITACRSARDTDIRVDSLLPGPANLHSHSFQRAMAGMSEYRAAGRDNFWVWRQLMYRFVGRLSPQQIEAIAALAFMEMQEAGYASVAEFHYLHHQPSGQRYDNPAELSLRILAAAQTTGIGLTLLPVLYSYGGARRAKLSGGQRRFANDVERFNRLVSDARDGARHLPADTKVGVAPHSLRATSPDELARVVGAHHNGPVHIHVSEQTREVEEIESWLGAPPVAWLLDNLPLDNNWCLVHATHMSENETLALARSGAVAGLCPITEANLGDGIFNGATYLKHGGAFGVGTDSNISVSLIGELRLLEYSQRLRERERNILVAGKEGSVGETLYLGAAAGGARALGRDAGCIRVGALADLVAVDRATPALCALSDRQLLDGLVFAAGGNVVTDLWSAGRHMVREGRHVARERIVADYRAAIAGLTAGL